MSGSSTTTHKARNVFWRQVQDRLSTITIKILPQVIEQLITTYVAFDISAPNSDLLMEASRYNRIGVSGIPGSRKSKWSKYQAMWHDSNFKGPATYLRRGTRDKYNELSDKSDEVRFAIFSKIHRKSRNPNADRKVCDDYYNEMKLLNCKSILTINDNNDAHAHASTEEVMNEIKLVLVVDSSELRSNAREW